MVFRDIRAWYFIYNGCFLMDTNANHSGSGHNEKYRMGDGRWQKMTDWSFKSLHIDKIPSGYRITNDSKYYIYLGYLPEKARKIREFYMIAPKEFSIIEHELDVKNMIIQIKESHD